MFKFNVNISINKDVMLSSLCPPASWRPVLLSTVSMLISQSPDFLFLPLSPPFASRSSVCSCLLCGMLFINLTTMTVCNS